MESEAKIASVGQRILGGLIDLVVTFVAVLVIGSILGLATSDLEEGQIGVAASVTGWRFLICALVVFLAFGAMEWIWGKTPGKMLLRMHVVGRDGQLPSPAAAIIRNLLRFIDGIALYLLGLVVMAIDRDKRRLGDLLAGTRVVQDETGTGTVKSN